MLTNTFFEIMREQLLNLLFGIWIYLFIIKYLYIVLTNKADEQFNFSFVMMVIFLQTSLIPRSVKRGILDYFSLFARCS